MAAAAAAQAQQADADQERQDQRDQDEDRVEQAAFAEAVVAARMQKPQPVLLELQVRVLLLAERLGVVVEAVQAPLHVHLPIDDIGGAESRATIVLPFEFVMRIPTRWTESLVVVVVIRRRSVGLVSIRIIIIISIHPSIMIKIVSIRAEISFVFIKVVSFRPKAPFGGFTVTLQSRNPI